MKATISRSLSSVEPTWNAPAAQADGRDDPDDREPEGQRRCARQESLGVLSEGHRGQRDRRCETDGRREPARHEAEGWTVCARKEVVFAARSREHRGQFSVAERSAERDEPADEPEEQQPEAGLNVRHLEPEACEDPDADHVGHYEGRRRRRRDGRCRSVDRWVGHDVIRHRMRPGHERIDGRPDRLDPDATTGRAPPFRIAAIGVCDRVRLGRIRVRIGRVRRAGGRACGGAAETPERARV